MSHTPNSSAVAECLPRAEPFGVRALREELGLTQLEFGKLIGLHNKASVSLVETGKAVSLPVALEIERLSIRDGVARIDAGTLCDAVRLARAACPGGCFLGSELDHATGITPAAAAPATGQAADLSDVPVQRQAEQERAA